MNIRLSERLIPRQIQDYGAYNGIIELGFESRSYAKNNLGISDNNKKANSNNTALKDSKSKILKYMDLLEQISEKEQDLNALYNKKTELEKEILNDPLTKNLLSDINEINSKGLNK